MTATPRPTLGLWRVVKVASTQTNTGFEWQITRNGEPVLEPFIYKGHAVHQKGNLLRAEGVAVVEYMRANRATLVREHGLK